MIDPTRISSNPQLQLNQTEGKKQPVLNDLQVHPDIDAHDIYKSESYEYRTPGILGGLFSREINAGKALERLTQGKKVKLRENVQLRGTYDGMDKVADRTIAEQKKDTILKSSEELESFARVESGATPQTDEEKLAQMLEKAEFKDLEGKKNGSFYEILDKKGKPISSFEAVKRLKDKNIVMLRERQVQGKAFSKYRRARGSYGKWLVDPNNLGRNESMVERKGSYGGIIYSVKSDYKRLESGAVSDAIPFNSVDQLKDFLMPGNQQA